jgi:hypothetical protein
MGPKSAYCKSSGRYHGPLSGFVGTFFAATAFIVVFTYSSRKCLIINETLSGCNFHRISVYPTIEEKVLKVLIS